MAEMVVIDKNGQWFQNVGAFPFTDPETGVCFPPGVQVQVKLSNWMKGQPVIQPVKEEDSKPEGKK